MNMSKDAYYFTHDSNAKDDPKCALLIDQLGMEGYGIYWMLIEVLRDQPDYKYPLALLPSLARKYNTTPQKIEAVIRGYQLFVVEGGVVFMSETLVKRMCAWENEKTRLLLALKPHLSNERQKRVEKAVKILKLLELAPMLGELGLFSL